MPTTPQFNPDEVPSTVDAAVEALYNSLSAEDRDALRTIAPAQVHHTLGQFIRNSWSMWDRDTPLVRDFCTRFKLFGHGDDVSGMIIASVWAKISGANLATVQEEQAANYREHWTRNGVDCLTGKVSQVRRGEVLASAPAVPAVPPKTVTPPESISVVLDDGSGAAYDAALHGPTTLQDFGDLQIVTKNHGTKKGRPVVLLTFSVTLPDGSTAKVQTVTTLQNFLNAATILARRYLA